MRPVLNPPTPERHKDSRRAFSPAVAAAAILLLSVSALAFPPSPHHTIFGQIRDELGNPLLVNSAEVTLETASGIRVRTLINPGIEQGANYRLIVPMDAGLTADPYKPTALRPTAPFRMQVRIGSATYLPMEMVADFKQLGKPSERTRIDLTLAEDTDGDGMPDAWERMLIAMLGGGLTLEEIRPGDDLTGSGINNYSHYIAGTYAWDPDDGFGLKIATIVDEAPVLDFLSIRGRSYQILGSNDLKDWTPVDFRPARSRAAPSGDYLARETRLLSVEIPPDAPDVPAFKFFKLMVR
jgi:hypothetical protein